MAAVSTILAGIGLGISAAGTVAGVAAANEQNKAQKEALAADQRAEDARRRAMDLDASRKRREIIRQAQLARATALTNATAQGAEAGSGLQGGFGAISGQSGVNTLGVTQNQELGGRIFDANAQKNAAHRNAASAGSMESLAMGISSLGGALTKNAGTIARIGGFA
jgi:hypothetical protein